MMHTGFLIASVILAVLGAILPSPYEALIVRLIAAALACFALASLF